MSSTPDKQGPTNPCDPLCRPLSVQLSHGVLQLVTVAICTCPWQEAILKCSMKAVPRFAILGPQEVELVNSVSLVILHCEET